MLVSANLCRVGLVAQVTGESLLDHSVGAVDGGDVLLQLLDAHEGSVALGAPGVPLCPPVDSRVKEEKFGRESGVGAVWLLAEEGSVAVVAQLHVLLEEVGARERVLLRHAHGAREHLHRRRRLQRMGVIAIRAKFRNVIGKARFIHIIGVIGRNLRGWV